jgi:hypothetical protein
MRQATIVLKLCMINKQKRRSATSVQDMSGWITAWIVNCELDFLLETFLVLNIKGKMCIKCSHKGLKEHLELRKHYLGAEWYTGLDEKHQVFWLVQLITNSMVMLFVHNVARRSGTRYKYRPTCSSGMSCVRKLMPRYTFYPIWSLTLRLSWWWRQQVPLKRR